MASHVKKILRETLQIPLFSEQPRNAKMLARHGGAIIFEKKNLDKPELLRDAITSILSNSRYNLSYSFRNPLQLFRGSHSSRPDAQRGSLLTEGTRSETCRICSKVGLLLAEKLFRFGRMPSMDPYGRKLSTVQYYNLDVFCVVSAALLSILGIVFYSIRWLFRRISHRKTKTE